MYVCMYSGSGSSSSSSSSSISSMPRPHAELENDWGKKVSLKRRRRRRAGQASKEGIEKRCRRDLGRWKSIQNARYCIQEARKENAQYGWDATTTTTTTTTTGSGPTTTDNNVPTGWQWPKQTPPKKTKALTTSPP